MDSSLFAAIAQEQRAELLRVARCCTVVPEQRRALPIIRRRLMRLLRSGSVTQPILCCA